MKKIILLLLFIPLISFGQDQKTVVESNTEIVNERELLLSEASTNVRVPITIDLSNYTHIALVSVQLLDWSKEGGLANPFNVNRHSYVLVSEALSFSIFEILNPYLVNKKQAKKDRSFLKNIKDDKYLYLSLRQQQGRGDDFNISINIRNSENKVIYSATSINVGLNESLAVLSDF